MLYALFNLVTSSGCEFYALLLIVFVNAFCIRLLDEKLEKQTFQLQAALSIQSFVCSGCAIGYEDIIYYSTDQ